MNRLMVPVLAVLLGASVVPVIQRSALIGRPSFPRPAVEPGAPGTSPFPGKPRALQDSHANALRLLRDGYLQEAQDAFLKVLSINPDDENALHGLIVVRQSMAGNDPQVLRQQAADYWDAIKRGVDTKEHYSRRAMEQLIVASVQGAREIEARRAASGAPAAAPPANDNVPPGGSAAPSLALPGIPAAPVTPPPTGVQPPPPSAPAARAAKPQTPPPLAANPPAPPAPIARPATSPAPPSSKAQLPPPSAPPAKPVGPQPPAPSGAPGQRGGEMPPTSPAFQVLPAPAVKPTAPQTPPSSTAPVQSGAGVPPTSPALQTGPQAARPTAPQTPPSSIAPVQSGAGMPPTSPALQTGPLAADKRLYMVRVGSLSDRDRASAVARQLSAAGFTQTRLMTETAFRVVSEPLPRSTAEGLVATLGGRGFHSQVEPLTRDTAQLLFGSFTSRKEAEALSQRIAAAGYDAWVREAATYTLQLGPYPQSSINTITGIVKSSAPDARVTAEPLP